MAATTPPSTKSAPLGRLVRFDGAERFVHWSTALLVGALFATGAILYIPSLSETVGRRLLIANIHTYCGIALFVPLLVALAGPWGAGLRRDLQRAGRLSYPEWRWLRRLGQVEVRLGKFNPGQKLNTVLLGSGLTVLLASGLVLRFPGPFSLNWRSGATFVHDWFALGIVILVAGHVTFALSHPEALRAMVRGWVTRSWARTHAPRWLAEEVGEEESDRSPAATTAANVSPTSEQT
jgi:formate dehydrogenase subunit gamma